MQNNYIPLSDVEQRVFSVIKKQQEQEMRPTLKSIKDEIGYSSQNSVAVVVNRLEEYGYIYKAGKKKHITVAEGM